ncbi:hemolysin family protein [Vagococcus intermedius]|uniref:Hemolysin family protein n=1 Tax=Vagococcus intermedius TaxID=2991418 RepID=A0AAF0CVW6_9ENTE|nr:hemolysin family protein [Vagococcus intermedius]WEG73812.1 hemolysin family protein [Vagococcus intermedius]WEG75897.1 hemolysin family protein [Vagococcus intermedius]
MNADPESQSLVGQLVILVVLTLLNAFFAAAEIAVVSLNKNRIEQKAEQGDKKALRLFALLSNSSHFLSTIQVGITLVNILAGASLADAFAKKLAPLFGDATWAMQLSKISVLVLLTYISIVFGELYPKRIALNKSEEVARFAIGPISAIGVIAKPFVWLLSASTDLLSKLTPMKFDDVDNKMTRDEMRYMLEKEGVLESEELEMVQGVFSLDTTVAREVMVPRTDAFMVDLNDPIEENLALVLDNSFSRIPVYDNDKDKVIGVLHLKRLLKEAYSKGFDKIDLLSILQEPLFVPETIFTDDLLYELKRTQNAMAILLDEYGGMVGIVTLEDLLEEIVGDIEDESDEVEKLYSQIEENVYYVQGRMPIDDFNELFDKNLDMKDVDTMAGYLITALGTIPDEDEKLAYEVEDMELVSEEMEGSRVLLIKVTFNTPNPEDSSEPEEKETKKEDKKFFGKDSRD